MRSMPNQGGGSSGGQPPKKKGKTGLILGIVGGVIALAAIAFVVLYMLGVFVKGGVSSNDGVIKQYWEAFSTQDKDKFRESFPGNASNIDDLVQSNYDQSMKFKDSVTIYVDKIEITSENYDVETINEKNYKAKEAKKNQVRVPGEQVIDGHTYGIVDCYEIITFKQGGKWFVFDVNETGAEITTRDGLPYTKDATTEDTEEVTTEEWTEEPTTEEVTTEAATLEITTASSGDTKTVGDSYVGYIDIPSSWLNFNDTNGLDVPHGAQYATADAGAIITLCKYDNAVDISEAAKNMVDTYNTQDGVENLSMEETTFAGQTAYKVSCYYTNDGVTLNIFLFSDPSDGLLHFASVEYTYDYMDSYNYLVNTFRFN